MQFQMPSELIFNLKILEGSNVEIYVVKSSLVIDRRRNNWNTSNII